MDPSCLIACHSFVANLGSIDPSANKWFISFNFLYLKDIFTVKLMSLTWLTWLGILVVCLPVIVFYVLVLLVLLGEIGVLQIHPCIKPHLPNTATILRCQCPVLQWTQTQEEWLDSGVTGWPESIAFQISLSC